MSENVVLSNKYYLKLQHLAKRIEEKLLRNGYRRLSIQTSGRWYIGLTIALGVAALSSGNNILYLLESFLLGGLILSGVLSEYAVSSLKIHWRRTQAVAEEVTLDEIVLTNSGKFTLFCVEAGEWQNGQFVPCAFIPLLESGASQTVSPTRSFTKRGRIEWQGLAVQTSFPFGFATKLKWLDQPGQRLVWPSRIKGSRKSHPDHGKTSRGTAEFLDGEIRSVQPEEDFRDIVWTLTLKTGQPVARHRSSKKSVYKPIINLDENSDEAFEKSISEIATELFKSSHEIQDATLEVRSTLGKKFVHGRSRILDFLSTVERAKGMSS